MELGATVCMPQRTQCQDCPLQPICQAASRWQEHLAAGGAPDDGPSVLAYPRKVRDEHALCVRFSLRCCDMQDHSLSSQAVKLSS